jgi:hypothetical protein
MPINSNLVSLCAMQKRRKYKQTSLDVTHEVRIEVRAEKAKCRFMSCHQSAGQDSVL